MSEWTDAMGAVGTRTVQRGGVRFGLLGPLEVSGPAGRVEVSSFKQRSLLALLLLNANQIVATDRIIDALWGDEAAKDRQNVLWVHVSNLRKALSDDGEDDESVLLTRSPGYLLQVEPGWLDVDRFEAGVSEGRALLGSDPAAASVALGEALGLWRGLALEDFVYEEWAQPEMGRLTELRLEAVEARIDADLARGLSRELVGELETVVTQHPLREHFTGQLMLALWRAGRQSDALRAFGHLRVRLADELGVDPSSELQQLEERILAGDPTLESPAVLVGGGLEPGLAVRGYELREKLGTGRHGAVYRAFQPAVGREVAIKVIRPELANDPEFIRNFEAEARLIAGLEHPHVVPLYDYWREPDAAYLVVRYMAGGSLDGVVNNDGLDESQVIQLISQIGGALAAAHERGIVHADVRPSNILLDDAGNSYLTDFGIGLPPDPSRAHVDYVAPELRNSDAAPSPAGDVFGLGRTMEQSGSFSGPLSRLIEQATATDPDRRFEDAGAMLDALARSADARVSPSDLAAPNPFKGLRAFEQNDAHLFFGRERLVERLVARLGQTGQRGRFVAVVGPSGSGKSSAVKAGLLPALHDGAIPGSERWFAAEMTPGTFPFEALADALESVAADRPVGLVDRLLQGQTDLADAVTEVLPDDSSRLVLVVDQFEELFHTSAERADRFIALLTEAIRSEPCPLRVVITVRADYSDRPLNHPALGRLMRDGTELISPMTPEELERAIQGPAEQAGVRFEPALVARIITDVADEPGGLPLLQYTLTELYDARQGTVIHSDSYTDLGGVGAALGTRADSVLASLDGPQRDTARQVFLRLVTLGEGAGDSRRRVRQTQLADLGGGPVQAVLDTFGRHRLLAFDRDTVTREPTVEIAHEALLRDWPQLRSWIDQVRDDLRLNTTLERAASEWVEGDRDPAYLLQGRRLSEAADLTDQTELAVRPLVGEYVDASSIAATSAAARRRRTRRRLNTGFAVAAAVASVLAVLAFIGRQQASNSADLAHSRQLAAAAISDEVLSADPELSLLLAIQSASVGEPTVEGMTALHQAISTHWTVFRYEWPEDRPYGQLNGDISPAGDAMLAYSFPGGHLEVVNIPDGSRRWSLEHSGADISGYFVSDGREIAVNVTHGGTKPAGIYLLDSSNGNELFHLPAPECSFTLSATSAGVAQSRFLFMEVSGEDCLGTPIVRVFDVTTREHRALGPAQTFLVAGRREVLASISADGQLAAVTTRDTRPLKAASLYHTNDGRLVREVLARDHPTLNQDGSLLVSANQHTFSASEVETDEVVIADSMFHDLRLVGGFFPDGRLWTTGEDGVVRIWEIPSGRLDTEVVAGSTIGFTALTADGTRMLIFGTGPTAALIDVSPSAGIELGRDLASNFLASPFTRRVPVTVRSADGAIQVSGQKEEFHFTVRNTDGRELIVPADGAHGARLSAAFIDDRQVVVGFANELAVVDGETMEVTNRRAWDRGLAPGARLIVSPDGAFIVGTPDPQGASYLDVLDPETLDTVHHISGAHAGIINAIAVSQDASLIASGSIDEWVRVWSAEDGSLVHAIRADDQVFGLEFANDDQHLLVTLETGDRFTYTLDPDELLEIARSRLTRGFTDAECARFEIDPCPTLDELRQA